MTRRLLWSTPWQPRRTLALGDHLAHAAATLVGIHNVEGHRHDRGRHLVHP
jgi:hypothetical protein